MLDDKTIRGYVLTLNGPLTWKDPESTNGEWYNGCWVVGDSVVGVLDHWKTLYRSSSDGRLYRLEKVFSKIIKY